MPGPRSASPNSCMPEWVFGVPLRVAGPMLVALTVLAARTVRYYSSTTNFPPRRPSVASTE